MTGILYETGLNFIKGGFRYGIWRLYDDFGYLIEAVDYEQLYKFTWEDILEFIKKENIDIYDSETYIYRINNTFYGKYWRISWNIKCSSSIEKNRRIVKLDGDTGKILSDEYLEAETER